jgi:hypothetical protein
VAIQKRVNGLKRSKYFLNLGHVNQFAQGLIDGLLVREILSHVRVTRARDWSPLDTAWRTCLGRHPSTWTGRTLAAVGMGHNQDAAGPRHSNGNEPLFRNRMIKIQRVTSSAFIHPLFAFRRHPPQLMLRFYFVRRSGRHSCEFSMIDSSTA